MVFHSPNFLIFMILLLIPFYSWKRGRIALLVVANAVFYGASGLGLLALFIGVSLVTFAVVHLMRKPGLSWTFWIGIAVNAGNILFFKYTLMILHTAERLIGHPLLLTDLARSWVTDSAGNLILPIGISFYTFQLISYLIDVRRGTTEPTRSIFRFWVYNSLFPALIAGPIMRGGELIPQLDELHCKSIRWSDIRFGLFLIFAGLIKKVLLADTIAVTVNRLFAEGGALTPEQTWQAAFLFGFQIYFDFSAYSDMALGLGYLLGIGLILNFRTPYLSTNPSEFWTRWHISLSRWIRDYIYIGLGGNRRGAVRTYVNLMAAMLISGLWHGAAWHFVAWGGVHGLLLVVYRWWTKGMNKIDPDKKLRSNWLYRLAAVVAFFHITAWTWVFFRAQSLTEAWMMTRRMLRVDVISLLTQPLTLVAAGLYALHIFEHWIRNREDAASRVWHRVPFPLRGAVYAGLILVMFYFMKGETYDFIYFQF